MQDINASPDSPVARLSASRKALFPQTAARNESPHLQSKDGSRRYEALSNSNLNLGNDSILQFAKHAVSGWWKYHPAHMAVDAGRPYLVSYARNKPWQLLGVAAGVGALAILVKPWRLVSMTGLAVAAVKSSNLSATALSFLTNKRDCS